MRHILLLFLLLSTLFATKGVKNEVYDTSGNKVLEYSNSYALLIGVSRYKHLRDLPSIPTELDKIKTMLSNNGFDVKPIVLNPDSQTLEDSYLGFMRKYGRDPNNRLLIYFSGHGHSEYGMGFLVPSDAPSSGYGIVDNSLSMDTIKAKAKKMRAKHALFLFDSCFSGAIFSTKGSNTAPTYIKKDIKNPIRYFITAGDEKQETPARSVFAECFIEAIGEAKADRNQDGYITGRELGMYLFEQVSERTKDGLKNSPLHGPINVPRLRKGDFVFFTQKRPTPTSYTFQTITPQTYSLTITPSPNDARVQILNITPKYYDGIKLKKGSYEIKVSKKGYYSKQGNIELRSDITIPVKLERIPKQTSIFQTTTTPNRAFPSTPQDKGSYIEPAMIKIKAGSFIMGSNNGDSDEKPVHKVTIAYDFYIGKYEVTFKEYDKFCEDTGREKPADGWGRENRPVINVSWNDAKAYTKWLSKKTRKTYRLPSEAEWEYAARAGTTTKYSFGDSKSDLNSYSWYHSNSNSSTHKVGQKRANPWGLYDMHGNVWEWCEDWYVDGYNNTPKDGSINQIGEQKYKVLRGGSWYDGAFNLRSAIRDRVGPSSAVSGSGFRVVGEP